MKEEGGGVDNKPVLKRLLADPDIAGECHLTLYVGLVPLKCVSACGMKELLGEQLRLKRRPTEDTVMFLCILFFTASY